MAAFCLLWHVAALGLFGSVLRPDFGPASDIDVLVTFAPEARWSLLDLAPMEVELALLFGAHVDLVSRRGVEQSQNWVLRKAILGTTEVIYRASAGCCTVPAACLRHTHCDPAANWLPPP